jgi:ABC-type protease/lipase transport system fused ATPase/permease subunit
MDFMLLRIHMMKHFRMKLISSSYMTQVYARALSSPSVLQQALTIFILICHIYHSD